MTIWSNDSLFDQEEESTNLGSSCKENGVKSRGESSFTATNFQTIKSNVSGNAKRKETAAA